MVKNSLLKREKFYKLALISIFAAGILLRIFVYCRNISFWGDEASIALNLMNKSYLELFKGLDYLQVAPPGFLILSKFILNIFNPKIDYIRDLLLRFFPFVFSCLSLLVFYKFSKKFIKDKKTLLFASTLFAFNPCAILYAAQLKQYSLELLVSVVLMSLFYRIIITNKIRIADFVLIPLSMWFSLSSLIISASGFIILLFKKSFNFIKLLPAYLLSFVVFYFFSLKSIKQVNYAGMYHWWSTGYGFFDLRHPMRLFIRFGELFSFDKTSAECFGIFFIFLILFSLIFSKKFNLLSKVFLSLPILITIILSGLSLYPIEARLILFLLPSFSIIIALNDDWKLRDWLISFFCIASFSASIYYSINPYKFYTSSREVVRWLKNHYDGKSEIILDNSWHRYGYYLQDYNNIRLLNSSCYPYGDLCKSELDSLKPGTYYMLVQGNPIDKLPKNIEIKDSYSLYSTVLYFKKK